MPFKFKCGCMRLYVHSVLVHNARRYISGGVVSFGFTVPAEKLAAAAATPLSWAVGPRWTTLEDTASVTQNMEHSFFSRVATEVDFTTGVAAAAAPVMDDKLQAHAWLTFLAWMVMVPVAVYVTRGWGGACPETRLTHGLKGDWRLSIV